MLKKTVTYTNFDDVEESVDLYFNLTKTELLEYSTTRDQKAVVDPANVKTSDVLLSVKEVVLLAYGVRSEDGKRFIKNDQLREEFQQTAAWDALFFSLLTDEDADKFLAAIMPKDMQVQLIEAVAEEKAKLQGEPNAGQG